LTDDDDNLFQRLMSDAKPLKAEERIPTSAKKPKPKARFTRADEHATLQESLDVDIDDLEESSGEALRFQRAAEGRTTMRMLSRGSNANQAEIDLHGMTLAEAKPRLESSCIAVPAATNFASESCMARDCAPESADPYSRKASIAGYENGMPCWRLFRRGKLTAAPAPYTFY
jgi:hypothetical protein